MSHLGSGGKGGGGEIWKEDGKEQLASLSMPLGEGESLDVVSAYASSCKNLLKRPSKWDVPKDAHVYVIIC